MALDKVDQVRMRIYDIPKNIFYPIFSDDEYLQFLEDANQNVLQAARIAALSASFYFSTMSTKEMVGDTEIWNEIGRQYLRALELFLNSNRNVIMSGIMPYAAGTSKADLAASCMDPDNPRTKNWLYKDKDGCEYILSKPEDSCCV